MSPRGSKAGGASRSAATDIAEKAIADIEAAENGDTAGTPAVSGSLAVRLKQMLAAIRAKGDVATPADLDALEAEIDADTGGSS